jgi:hypothetical protein
VDEAVGVVHPPALGRKVNDGPLRICVVSIHIAAPPGAKDYVFDDLRNPFENGFLKNLPKTFWRAIPRQNACRVIASLKGWKDCHEFQIFTPLFF